MHLTVYEMNPLYPISPKIHSFKEIQNMEKTILEMTWSKTMGNTLCKEAEVYTIVRALLYTVVTKCVETWDIELTYRVYRSSVLTGYIGALYMLFSNACTVWPGARLPRNGEWWAYASSPYFRGGGLLSPPGFCYRSTTTEMDEITVINIYPTCRNFSK